MDTLVRPETLTAAVARHVGELIVTGEFPPDSRLPEITLASRLKVARGTVREALRLLADQGLVDVFPHRGAVVAPVTRQKLEEVCDLRSLLESHAARIAAEAGRLDEAGMREITRALDRMRAAAAASDDPLAFGDADLAFHATVSALAGNDTLMEILIVLGRQIRRYMFWGKVYDESDVNREFTQHVRLQEVFATGDPSAIEAAVRDHIGRAKGILMAHLTRREASYAGTSMAGNAVSNAPRARDGESGLEVRE